MKRTIILLGLIVSAIALADCTKNEDNIVADNNRQPFELYVSPSTRTAVNADDHKQTDWAAGDAITVLHCAQDGEYVNDGEFTIAAEDLAAGRFTGTLGSAIAPDKSHIWYALYPHAAANSSAASPTDLSVTVKQSQTQTGSNRNHICGDNAPLLGMVPVVPAGNPNITMNHLTTLLKVVVTNPTADAITVKTVKFGTSIQKISGKFKVNGSGGIAPQAASYNNSTLTVSGGGEIASNGSAEFFIAVAPFTATADETLTVMVTLSDGRTCTVEKTLTAATAFVAGKVNTLNVSFASDTKYYELSSLSAGTFIVTAQSEVTRVMNTNVTTGSATNLQIVSDDIGAYYDSANKRFVSTPETDAYQIIVEIVESSTAYNIALKSTATNQYIGVSTNGVIFSSTTQSGVNIYSKTLKDTGTYYLRNTNSFNFCYGKAEQTFKRFGASLSSTTCSPLCFYKLQ